MQNFVRKTLETYLRERRILTQGEFTADDIPYTKEKNAAFVTLYHDGKVIASQGRIQCKKENTLLEVLDLSLACLMDSRFSENLKNPEMISGISVRVDILTKDSRRMIKNITELNAQNEGIIFLSQNLGKMSIILPNMIKTNPTPENFLEIAKKKA